MKYENTTDSLNKLIEINNDRIEGYETASKETDEVDLLELFSTLVDTSEECREELVEEVQRLGGKPVSGTKVTGKFFRAWMDVKAALTGRDRKAILSSCEFGEDQALAAYDKVLKDDLENLTTQQQDMIIAQRELLRADHDEVKTWRDNFAKV